MNHLLKALLAALYAVKEHIELLLWPCRHKGVHHIAGCANAAAGSKKGIVVQLIVTCWSPPPQKSEHFLCILQSSVIPNMT